MSIPFLFQLDQTTVNDAVQLYQRQVHDKSLALDVDSFRTDPAVAKMMDELDDLQTRLRGSPLFELWLLYLDMIDILHLNIYAERTGIVPAYCDIALLLTHSHSCQISR